LRALSDLQVTEKPRLVHGVLHSSSADAGTITDLADRKITYPVSLHLTGDDAQHSPLALSVVMAHCVG
jgi:hypothetical protein